MICELVNTFIVEKLKKITLVRLIAEHWADRGVQMAGETDHGIDADLCSLSVTTCCIKQTVAYLTGGSPGLHSSILLLRTTENITTHDGIGNLGFGERRRSWGASLPRKSHIIVLTWVYDLKRGNSKNAGQPGMAEITVSTSQHKAYIVPMNA
jgi:hypothetical protein